MGQGRVESEVSSQGPSHSCRVRGLHHTSLVWGTPAAQLRTNGLTSPALICKANSVGLSSNWLVLWIFVGSSSQITQKCGLFVCCSVLLG